MTLPSSGLSPATLRAGGLMYLAIIGLGLFGEVGVRGALSVPGDALATLARIEASPGLWRLGIAGDLLMHVLDVPLIVILYRLLRPVDRALALQATLWNLVQTAVLVANKLTLVLPLLALQQMGSSGGMARAEAARLCVLALNLHAHGFAIGLIFFGVACVLRGVLIVRADGLPRVLGVLLGAAGLSYLANSAALLLAPALADALFPVVLLPALVGELALCGWLLWAPQGARPAGRPGG